MGKPCLCFPATCTVAVCTISISTVVAYLLWKIKQANTQIDELTEQVKREKDLKEVERLGRINVQQRSRISLTNAQKEAGYFYKAIGYVESPFPDRRGTPRQPILVPAGKSPQYVIL
jgi:hypothetical protein